MRTLPSLSPSRQSEKVGRHGVRDGAIILLMFRHGLRTAAAIPETLIFEELSINY